MRYVLDIYLFRHLFGFYLKRFPSLWVKFDEFIEKNKIVSLSEVFREIINGKEGALKKWASIAHMKKDVVQESNNKLVAARIPNICKYFNSMHKSRNAYGKRKLELLIE